LKQGGTEIAIRDPFRKKTKYSVKSRRRRAAPGATAFIPRASLRRSATPARSGPTIAAVNTPFRLILLLASGAACAATPPVRTPVVLDVQNVHDAVVDRFGVVYASSEAGVRRFDLRTGAELASLQMPGAVPRTLALDPSGCRLAVADVSGVNQGVWVLEDLGSSSPRKILFPQASFNGGFGSFSVIWEAADTLLSSSTHPETGGGPIRRTRVSTGMVEVALSAGKDAMLAAAANGRRWARVEAGNGSGPVHLWDVASGTALDQADAGLSTYEVAISRDGDVVTVPTYAGALVFDVVQGQLERRAAPIGAYSDYGPIGMVFSPHTTASFAAVGGWGPPDRGVFMYLDYSFLAPVRLDPAQFTWSIRALDYGRTRISADGRHLLVTQPDNVLIYDVAEWSAKPGALFSDGAECSTLR
jgi:hypothetical protein